MVQDRFVYMNEDNYRSSEKISIRKKTGTNTAHREMFFCFFVELNGIQLRLQFFD